MVLGAHSPCPRGAPPPSWFVGFLLELAVSETGHSTECGGACEQAARSTDHQGSRKCRPEPHGQRSDQEGHQPGLLTTDRTSSSSGKPQSPTVSRICTYLPSKAQIWVVKGPVCMD